MKQAQEQRPHPQHAAASFLLLLLLRSVGLSYPVRGLGFKVRRQEQQAPGEALVEARILGGVHGGAVDVHARRVQEAAQELLQACVAAAAQLLQGRPRQLQQRQRIHFRGVLLREQKRHRRLSAPRAGAGRPVEPRDLLRQHRHRGFALLAMRYSSLAMLYTLGSEGCFVGDALQNNYFNTSAEVCTGGVSHLPWGLRSSGLV